MLLPFSCIFGHRRPATKISILHRGISKVSTVQEVIKGRQGNKVCFSILTHITQDHKSIKSQNTEKGRRKTLKTKKGLALCIDLT